MIEKTNSSVRFLFRGLLTFSILAKGQPGHSYIFRSMPIITYSPVANFGDQSLCTRMLIFLLCFLFIIIVLKCYWRFCFLPPSKLLLRGRICWSEENRAKFCRTFVILAHFCRIWAANLKVCPFCIANLIVIWKVR